MYDAFVQQYHTTLFTCQVTIIFIFFSARKASITLLLIQYIYTRLITELSDDVDNNEPLTSNHLLMLHGNSDLSWGSFEVRDMYKERWRYSQHLGNQFWRRWKTE